MEHPFTSIAFGAWFSQAAKNRRIVALRRAGEVRLKQILESAPL